MRPVHYILAAIVAAAIAVGALEDRPVVSEFVPEMHGAFKDRWLAKHPGLDEEAFRKNWDERTHITYWEKWGGFEGEGARKMVDAFNDSQDEIYCHYIPTTEVDRKTLLAIVGGCPPDVAGLWGYSVPPFADANALMPLDTLMAESKPPLTAAHYVPNYLKLCQYRGRTYALPSSPATIALYCNLDHFERKADKLRAAGLDPDGAPRTITELDAYAEILTEAAKLGPDGLAVGPPNVMGFMPTEPGWFTESWVYFFGGRLADEAGNITTAEPANIRAFAWLRSYATRYGGTNLRRFQEGFGNYDSPQNAFIDGKVSMVLHGTYFAAFIDRHRPNLRYKVVPFPPAEGVPGPRSLLVEDVLVIPKGCPHPEAAWTFLHFVQTKGLPILCRLLGRHLPIRATPAGFAQTHPNPFLNVFTELAHSKHSFIMPQSVVWREYRQEMRDAFDHIWLWKVPKAELAGLSGKARDTRIAELCKQEIVKTLRGVQERMTDRLKQKHLRIEMRRKRAGT